MSEVFDLDAFMEGLSQDSARSASNAEDRLNRVLMNLKGNQGTVEIIPFISKKVGNVYSKVEGVREFKACTAIIDKEDPVWYRVLPMHLYGQLTDEQIELYEQVTGLYDELFEYDLGYSEIRIRNYAMFTGVATAHRNTEDEDVEDYIGVPGLFIFPATNVISALNSAIANKKSSLGEKTKLYLQKIFSASRTGRSGVIQISFKKSSGIGYDSTVNIEVNSEFRTFVDPEREFSEEFVANFDDPLRELLGWIYDRENDQYFNETAFKELRDHLTLRLKDFKSGEDKEGPKENANGSVDPMKDQRPPVPGVETPKAGRPF